MLYIIRDMILDILWFLIEFNFFPQETSEQRIFFAERFPVEIKPTSVVAGAFE